MSAFPDLRKGRVVDVSVQNSRELEFLQGDCQKELQSEFHPEDRLYVPHLTVASLRNARNLSDVLSPVKNQRFGSLEVKELILYGSRAGGAFSVYYPLLKLPLRDQRPINEERNFM